MIDDVRRLSDELARDSRLPCGMAGFGDDVQLGFGPRGMQVMGRRGRTHDVVPALDDDRRQVADAIDALQQSPFVEEALVHEVMSLDPRQCERRAVVVGGDAEFCGRQQ